MAEELRKFTVEELKEFNGENGKPIYIAYKERVIDVTASKMWRGGQHMKRHTRRRRSDRGDRTSAARHRRAGSLPPGGDTHSRHARSSRRRERCGRPACRAGEVSYAPSLLPAPPPSDDSPFSNRLYDVCAALHAVVPGNGSAGIRNHRVQLPGGGSSVLPRGHPDGILHLVGELHGASACGPSRSRS